jgi:hypothetical protein
MNRFVCTLCLILLLTSLVLSACSPFAAPTAGPLIPGLAQTLAAQTLAAQDIGIYQIPPTQAPQQLTGAETAYAYVPSNTPEPAASPIPQLTPFKNSPQLGQSANDPACINAALFVKDVSFPDNSSVNSKQQFTKIWQFKNSGTCTWTPDYALVFVWGDQMGGMTPKPLGVTVEPGQTVDVAINLVAPKEGGWYQGNWIFQDPSGKHFGTGYKARDFFWVSVEVSGGYGILGGYCIGGG